MKLQLNKFQLALWWGLILLLSLGQFQRVEWFGVSFYIHDVVIAGWSGWLLFLNRDLLKNLRRIKWVEVLKKYRIELLLVAWILLGWLVAGVSGKLGLRAGLYGVRFGVYVMWWWLLRRSKVLNRKLVNWGLVALVGLVAWFGLLQYLFLPDVRFLKILGWDDHYYRLVGTQFDPQFTGIILVLGLVLWQKIKLRIVNKRWLEWIRWVGNVLLVSLVMMTFSRSSFLSLGVAVLFLVWQKKRDWWKWLLVGMMAVVVMWSLPKPGGEGVKLDRVSTVDSRFESSQNLVEEIEGVEWIMGQGLFNTARPEVISDDGYERSYHAGLPDNIVVFVLQSLGLVGLGLVLWLWGKWSWKWWQTDQFKVIALNVVLVHAMFNNTLFQPFVFLVLLGFV
jgi:hypothetical protein